MRVRGSSRVKTEPALLSVQVQYDVYPVGRLDYDSEGLLLLTNDPRVNQKLLDPAKGHDREYYVQVEGAATQEVCAVRYGLLALL